MKRILKFILPMVIAAALGTTGIFVFKDNTEYYVDTTYFQSTYAYRDDINLEGLKIVETEKDEIKAEHQVDESMVVSCDSTSSVGEKTLVLTYDKEVFTVNFVVMYEIQFISNNEVIDLQYIYKASEIVKPEDPKLTGYEFKGWNPQIPNVINDNMTFEATFSDTPESIPNLGVYEATYGDTLESIKLPSNQYGSWVFVNELTTKVGNVGTNTFEVEFRPTNSELKVIKDTVEIVVAKKRLEFRNVVTTFDYDGKEHLPTYELEVEGLNVVTMGTPGVEVGTYFVMYVIQDDNYEGQWQGNYTIAAKEITVSFNLTEESEKLGSNDAYYIINLGEALPEINYTVNGVDADLLQIKLEIPKTNHALTNEEINIVIGNTSYKNVVITNKCYLTINKISLGAGLPDITGTAVYGNKLSSVTFEDNNPNGYWSWENPDYVFEATGEYVAKLVFTPYSSLDYKVESIDYELTVLKRTLTFDDIVNNYTYDGLEHTIEYKLFDGENEITGINVVGQIVQMNVGIYETQLNVVDENYDGSIPVSLIINKANPETNFNVVFDNIVYGTMLKNIPNMPKGYTWKIDTTVLEKAGENKIDVIFTPEDIDNYNIVTGQFTVNVIKKTVSIDSLNEYKFIYDGSNHKLYDVFFSREYEDEELKFYDIDITLEENANKVPNDVILMNAGTYTVYITLLENEEYSVVVKAVNVIIETSGVTIPTNCTAVYGDLLSSVNLPEIKDEEGNVIGKWIWENQDPTATVGDAGERTHKAIFETDNDNYKAEPVEVKVIVAKKNVIIKVEDNDRIYLYDGNEHTIIYTVYDGQNELELNVTGNKTSINACKESVTLVVEEANYAGSLTTELEVKSIDPIVEWPTLTVQVYTSLFDLKSQLVEGMNFTCQNVEFDEVGTFTFDAEFVQPNDEFNNYNKLTGKVTVIVESADAMISGVEESYEFTYGEEIIVNAIASHDESKLVYTYSQNGEIVTKVVNVGTYELNITLPATGNYNEVSINTIVIIKEKEVTVSWAYEPSYVYGGVFDLPVAYIMDVTNARVYLEVTEINNKDFVNADTYKFVANFESVFVNSSNYKLLDNQSEEIEIEKAIIDLAEFKWNYSTPFFYTGKEYTVELLNVHSALTPIYCNNVKADAGNYTATVTFEYDETNYELINEVAVCEWAISSSSVTVTWTYADEYVFTGSALTMPKASILDGTIELTVKVVDGKEFRNAGTYVFIASLEDGNYALSGITSKEVTVEQAELTVEWTYENEYVYNGKVLTNPTAKVIDLLGTEVELMTISYNGIFKNAGEYTFDAIINETYLDKDNYILLSSVSDTVEVIKADYVLSDMDWDYSSAFVYDGAEHKVELINVVVGLTPKYDGNVATNAGEYTATVTFDYDKANYNEPTFDELAWNIEAKVVTVEWTYEEEYVYTGSTLAAPTAAYKNLANENVKLNVVEINGKEFVEADIYSFVASIANELDANNYELYNPLLQVEITKTQVGISGLTAIYGQTLADVELPTSEFGTWAFIDPLTTNVGDAGKNRFDVEFISNSDNYESYETTVTITVEKKTVVISVEENEFTYDGTNKTLVVKVLDGQTELDIDVLGNVVANNASTTQTTLSINHKNYKADVVETELIINKATATIINTLTITNSDYDGDEVDLKGYFTLNHDETELDIDITLARNIQSIKDAGVYTVVVTAAATSNYLEAAPVIVVYTVNQISPEISYTAPQAGYTYNGSALSVSEFVSHNNTDSNVTVTYKYQLLDGETYVDVDSIVEAGTYKVTASIASTTNFTEDSIEFTVVVEKGTFNVDELEAIDAIYGQQLNHFDFAEVEGGSWAWENPNDYVGDAGTRTHKAIFTPNDESLEVVEIDVTFNVQPKSITITLGQKEFTYDGEEHTVTYTLSETPEGVIVSTEGTISATDYKENGYAFKLEITSNDNYVGSVEGVLVINKADLELTAPELNATYGETLADVTLPTAENGTWSFVQELTTSVGAAGTKNIAVKFTPNSTNYNEKTLSAKLVVAKADYTPTAIPTTYDATYGDLLSTLTLPTTDTNGTWRWDSNGTVGNAGTNTFTATFTHTNVNYNVYQASVTVNVAKADSVITNKLPGNLVYTGSELIKKYFTLNHNESSLVFTVTGKGTSVVNAGTYQVVVSVAESTNYNAATLESIEVVVAKATPTTDFSTTFTYTYGKVLSNDDLSNGYEWINLSKLEVGTHQAPAKFVPTNIENYEVVTKYFVVTIEKIIGTITVVNNQQFTYGDVIDLGATTNNADQDSAIVETGLSLNTDGFVDAGTYTVTLTVAESAHYTAATATVTVTIDKKEEEIKLPETFEYGTTTEDIKPTESTYGTFTVYDEDPSAVSSVSVSYNSDSTNSMLVETKTIWVQFIPHEQYAKNFAEFVEKIVITIVKKKVEFTNVQSSFVYDGSAHNVTYKLSGLVGDAAYTVTGNDTYVTNVADGTVDVTLSIDSKYYYGSWTGVLQVTPATPNVSFENSYNVYWNSKLSDITLPTNYYLNENDRPLTTISDSQTFDVIYDLKDTNYVTVTGTFIVNVKKLVTVIDANDETFVNLTYVKGKTYQVTATAANGGEATPTITVNGSLTYIIGNAGTYNVVVSVAETEHYQAAEYKFDIKIAKTDPTTSFTTVLNGTYGNKLSSVVFPNATEGSYAWTDANIDLATGTQQYEATFTPKDTTNYNSVTAKFTVNVAKATAIVSADAKYTFTFDGNVKTLTNVTYTEGADKALEFTYKIGETVYESLLNAGTYTVIITLPESTNYLETSTTTTVVINKAKVEVPSSLTATYGDTLEDVALPTSTYGVWTYEKELTTSVGLAGNNTFNVSFTANDTYKANYADFDAVVTIVVSMLQTQVTATIPTDLVYNGTTFDHTKWFIGNHQVTNINISLELNGEPVQIVKDAGTYTIYVSMAEQTNATTAFYGEYSVTVLQAEYIVSSVAIGSDVIYGDSLANSILSGGDSEGTWTWVSSTDSVGGAGSRTHTAKFIPTNGNYAASSHLITINVGKKQITFNSINKNEADEYYYESKYNGSVQKISYNFTGLVNGDTVDKVLVTGNTGLQYVGIQSFTLKVADNDANYYSDAIEVTFEIKVGIPTITLPTHTNVYQDRVTYEELLVGATASDEGKFSYSFADVKYPEGSKNSSETIEIKVTFTPKDQDNYESASGMMKVTLVAVAKNDSGVYFGRVEDAIKNTTSGTISIVVGTNPIIKSNIVEETTIRSGVTLFIPYSEDCTQLGNKGTAYIYGNVDENLTKEEPQGYLSSNYAFYYGYDFATNHPTYLKNTLTISEDVTLINNGTIEVAGQLSGAGGGAFAAGQTAGLYSRIVMKQNAEITNNGNIYCYGYIEEETLDNGSIVNVTNTGIIYQPFVLRDFRGGTVMSAFYEGINEHHISAFDSFELRNISSIVNITYGGRVIAWANLYAGDQQNLTTIAVIGTSGSIINLSNQSSYLISKYNPNTEINKVDIYGGAYTSSMTLSLKIQIIGQINVSTADVYFPITWRYNITLHKAPNQNGNAIYNMGQRFKLMNGAILKVEKGAELTINEINVYENYVGSVTNADGGVMAYQYHEGSSYAKTPHNASTSPAKLIVNGKVTISSLGGNVYTESSGGELIIGSVGLTTREGLRISRPLITGKIDTYQTIGGTTELIMYANGRANSTGTIITSGGTYYSKDGGWYSKDVTIKYTNDGVTNELNETINANGYDLSNITLESKKGYTFDGWYYDKDYTNKVNGNIIYGNTTIYAKWILNEYTVNYHVTKDDNISEAYTLPTDLSTKFDITTGVNVYIPTFNSYTFDGWYNDADLLIAVPTLTYDGLIQFADANGVINLYGNWQNEIYYINYNLGTNPNGLSLASQGTISKTKQSFTLQAGNGGDYNSTMPSYFGGWFIDSNCETTPVAGMTLSDLEQYISNDEVTVYAKWLDKVVVTTSVGNDSAVNAGYKINGLASITQYYMLSDLSSYKVPTDSSFTTANNNKAFALYLDGWCVGSTKVKDGELTSSMVSNNAITVTGKWESKVVVITNIGENAPTSATVKGGRSVTEYYMNNQLSTYVINDNYDSLKTDANISHYFDNWYVGSSKFTGTLSESQAVDGVITVTGKWVAKCVVTLNISVSGSGAKNATYSDGNWSASSTGTYTLYVTSGTTVKLC